MLAAAPDASVREAFVAVAIMERLMQQGRSLAAGETMAMALAEAGRFDDAVRWQREVIAPAQRRRIPTSCARLSANLQRYQRQQACREPWRRMIGAPPTVDPHVRRPVRSSATQLPLATGSERAGFRARHPSYLC